MALLTHLSQARKLCALVNQVNQKLPALSCNFSTTKMVRQTFFSRTYYIINKIYGYEEFDFKYSEKGL